MKKIISFLVVLGLMSGVGVYAGEESYEEKKAPTSMEDRAVIYHDFDLELEIENGKVFASWDEFDIEGFDWFKLVHSTTNSAPVYPNDKTRFVWNVDQTEASFKLEKGVNYIRICAVVLNDDYSKDRYCGKVQSIDIDEDDVSDNPEKKEVYKAEKKETYKAKAVEQKNKTKTLSVTLKKRVDDIIESFINRLLEKDYSDTEIVSTIDVVLERLENYENKSQYVELLSYMEEVLMEYRNIYDNPLGDLEDIFSDL